MTKLTLFLALGVAAISTPSLAQHTHYSGGQPMVGANDVCVLGANVVPGNCIGPVRVAQTIVSEGSVNQSHQVMHSQHVAAHAQMPVPMYAPVHVPVHTPVHMSGCVPGYGGPNVPCHGVWVPAPTFTAVPVHTPVPAYVPPPIYMPAQPVYYAPEPQQIAMIPTSLFTGGITYGAGFPTDTTYSYGGGGYGFVGGGTRFSGVRERSPTPLIAPPPRQRHAPPSVHPGCGC